MLISLRGLASLRDVIGEDPRRLCSDEKNKAEPHRNETEDADGFEWLNRKY